MKGCVKTQSEPANSLVSRCGLSNHRLAIFSRARRGSCSLFALGVAIRSLFLGVSYRPGFVCVAQWYCEAGGMLSCVMDLSLGQNNYLLWNYACSPRSTAPYFVTLLRVAAEVDAYWLALCLLGGGGVLSIAL